MTTNYCFTCDCIVLENEHNCITMDTKKITNVKIEGIDPKDHPDYDGKPMTDDQLEELNEDSDFVYECVQNYLF